MKIAPSEAWNLDYIEMLRLTGFESNSSQDISFAVNAVRMSNGCKPEQLRNVNV